MSLDNVIELSQFYSATPSGFDDSGESLDLSDENRHWPYLESAEVDPNEVVFYRNIRGFNSDHVDSLALSIYHQSQQSPVIADQIYVELPNGEIVLKYRILAGQHRAVASWKLNKQLRAENREPIPLKIKYYPRTLSSEEVLEVQITENIHHAMTPAEEAESINKLWELYVEIHEEKATKAGLARRLGKTPEKVYDALRFTEMDSLVRYLVHNRVLYYSFALELAKLPPERQFSEANYIVLNNLSIEVVRRRIKNILQPENGSEFGLFSQTPDEMIAVNEQDFRLTLQNTVGNNARAAARYFETVAHYLELIPETERLRISAAAGNTLRLLIEASDTFTHLLTGKRREIVQQLLLVLEQDNR